MKVGGPSAPVYRLTNDGEHELIAWLRKLLAKPTRGSIQFVAAISFLGHLPPKNALEQLGRRASILKAETEGLRKAIEELQPKLGRLLMLEAEYEQAMKEAELVWVQSLIDDLQSGDLTWKPQKFFPRRL